MPGRCIGWLSVNWLLLLLLAVVCWGAALSGKVQLSPALSAIAGFLLLVLTGLAVTAILHSRSFVQASIPAYRRHLEEPEDH